ncbi:MAG TPA: DUF4332 domain-containing protein, partial [Bacteroidales bacterium]|nr:DUF4332 domain-containing protein [Bacteroidales bacterium]
FAELGIPEEWIQVLTKLGYVTVEKLKNAKAGKLHNEICGFNKENKLGLTNPALDDVKNWLGQ